MLSVSLCIPPSVQPGASGKGFHSGLAVSLPVCGAYHPVLIYKALDIKTHSHNFLEMVRPSKNKKAHLKMS